MSAAARPGQVLAGIAMVVGATLLFAATDTIVKYVVSGSVPLLMALWARYAFQAVVTSLVVIPIRGWSVLRTRQPLFHWLRGLLLVTSSLLVFASLRYMPVGEFTAIMLTAPLVITLLAGSFLKEQVSPLRWALVCGGFIGTLVIIRPGGESFSAVMLLPLAQVACNAWFQILTSRLARTENPLTLQMYTGWVGALLVTPALPYFWTELASAWLWAPLVAMGVLGALGHFMLILAYQRAPAMTLTPYLYFQIAFAMVGGWLVFGHVPDGWAFLGMALITACGVAGGWLTVLEQRRR